jgi:hypothetical protein
MRFKARNAQLSSCEENKCELPSMRVTILLRMRTEIRVLLLEPLEMLTLISQRNHLRSRHRLVHTPRQMDAYQ